MPRMTSWLIITMVERWNNNLGGEKIDWFVNELSHFIDCKLECVQFVAVSMFAHNDRRLLAPILKFVYEIIKVGYFMARKVLMQFLFGNSAV